MEIHESILGTVGRTPMVWLRRLAPPRRIAVKIEGANPLGSLKERIAVAMVEGAERDGLLRPGMTIVESSSGNTGIGLAMVCAVKRYPLLVTMSKKVSVERRRMLVALGAEVVLVDGGSDEAWDEADRIAASDPRRYFRIHQYTSPYNVRCHYETTGPEIWQQTGGRIAALVATLGTTGTIVGAGRFLKERSPRVRVVAVQPDRKDHAQQGIRTLRYQRVPPIWDASVVDETIEISDDEAFEYARRLAREEGIFAGISSGTAVAGARRILDRVDGLIVAILPDRGEKYLSTPLFGAGGGA